MNKKILALIVGLLFIVPSVSFAATTTSQDTLKSELIATLQQLLVVLEQELATVQAAAENSQTNTSSTAVATIPSTSNHQQVSTQTTQTNTQNLGSIASTDTTPPIIWLARIDNLNQAVSASDRIELGACEPLDVSKTEIYKGTDGPGMTRDANGMGNCDSSKGSCTVYTDKLPVTVTLLQEEPVNGGYQATADNACGDSSNAHLYVGTIPSLSSYVSTSTEGLYLYYEIKAYDLAGNGTMTKGNTLIWNN